ncbi:MAG TPA: O-antigen ligase family protein [Patescibacteria group bacterium]
MNSRKHQLFKLSLILIIILELLSLTGHLVNVVNQAVFLVLLLIVLILSLKKLEYGLYFIVAELIIGSQGYLFSFDVNGLHISLRIGLFIIIMSVWLVKLLKARKLELRKSNLFWFYAALFIAIIWGAINGFLKDNSLQNLFFDANGYLFLLMALPFYAAINNLDQIKRLLEVGAAAVVASVIKVFITLYLFSHFSNELIVVMYKWIRDSRVGEITLVPGGFFRIFFQSQLYAIIAFFIILAFLIRYIYPRIKGKIKIDRHQSVLLVFATVALTSALISFSRSFWAAMMAAGGVLIIFVLIKYKNYFFSFLKSLVLFSALLFLSVGLMSLIIRFPVPKTDLSLSAFGLLQARALALSGEAAVSSRWNLLPVLWEAITIHPVLGSGFGTTVTYQTADPRILALSPSGDYTTYAFEWGYLDIWLKLGLIGLMIYLALLFKILINGFKLLKNKADHFETSLVLGLFLSLIFLIVTHNFTPYLNHPLGISYLLLTARIFDILA